MACWGGNSKADENGWIYHAFPAYQHHSHIWQEHTEATPFSEAWRSALKRGEPAPLKGFLGHYNTEEPNQQWTRDSTDHQWQVGGIYDKGSRDVLCQSECPGPHRSFSVSGKEIDGHPSRISLDLHNQKEMSESSRHKPEWCCHCQGGKSQTHSFPYLSQFTDPKIPD